MRSDSESSKGDPRSQPPVGEGELLADKYRVGPVIGVGGMGVVVSAHDELLDRQVAIKFLLPRLAWSEVSVQRFFREARAATRITSEHVVRLLEIDKLTNGVPFFVMEYLVGEDLKSRLNAKGPLSIEEAADYLMQSLQAIAEGHTKRVVHRDVKPGNLFLTHRADGTPLVKVLDFGIAKTLQLEQASQASPITQSEDVLLGSPSYMSPEQLMSPRDVDPRSDIWSLGVTLYEVLSGTLPFDGDTRFALMTNIIQANCPPLAAPIGSPSLPEALVHVVQRCLQKKREDRFANASELAQALAPFGTEDASMSLRRIRGLTSPAQASGSTPARGIESVRAVSTTLPIQRHAAASSPATPARKVRGKARGWWFAAGGALLAAVVGTSWLITPQSESAGDVPVVPAAVPAAGLAPQVIEVASAAVVAPVASVAELSPNAARPASDASDKSDASLPSASAAKTGDVRAPLRAPRNQRVRTQPSASSAPTAMSVSSAGPIGTSGPSRRGIEALIRERR